MSGKALAADEFERALSEERDKRTIRQVAKPAAIAPLSQGSAEAQNEY